MESVAYFMILFLLAKVLKQIAAFVQRLMQSLSESSFFPPPLNLLVESWTGKVANRHLRL